MANDPSHVIDLDSDDAEDADLRFAIALSLEKQDSIDGVHNGDEVEDRDLRRAIALSLGQSANDRMNDDSPVACVSPVSKDVAPTQDVGVAFGEVILDRKKMEKERLARMKRKPADAVDVDRSHQKAKLGPLKVSNVESNVASSGRLPDKPFLQYPHGTVKRTWAAGYPRDRDIKIEEVLMKDELELAILSSFVWDESWLLRKIDMSRTKLVLVAFASSENQVRSYLSNLQALQSLRNTREPKFALMRHLLLSSSASHP
jgi:Tyrosyl-DNA phosphodiesterase/Ubiquitin interaction motif